MKCVRRSDVVIIVLLGCVQGFFTAFSLEPYNFPLIGWLLPWPLFYLAERFRKRTGMLILSGLSCSLFFNLFTFYWVVQLLSNFAGLGMAASATGFLFFALLSYLQLPVFVVLFGVSMRFPFRKYLNPRWLTAGVLALLADYYIPKVFDCRWGNFIAGNPYIVQIADITGIFGLTFILFSTSYFFYRIFRAIFILVMNSGNFYRCLKAVMERAARPWVWKRLFPVPLLLILCFTYGIIRKNQIEHLQKSLPTFRVAIINPAAPPEDYSRINKRIMRQLIHHTIPGLVEKAIAAGGGMVDLVVLPESAVPFMCADDTLLSRHKKRYTPESELMVQLIAYNWNVDVFLNETAFKADDRSDIGSVNTYNSSVLYSSDGRRRDSYHKRILLAFGEYLPGEKFFAAIGLKKWIVDCTGGSRFSAGPISNTVSYSIKNRNTPYKNSQPISQGSLAGKSPRQFEKEFPKDRRFIPDGYFLPLICYEALFSDHVRSFFNKSGTCEPDFIVNITQDGWYGDTIEIYQHFELARIRAVETRRALVRSVNDGAAGFVDMAGNYVRPLAGPVMTKSGAKDYQVWDVPVCRNMQSIYVRFGDAWMALLAAGFAVLIILRVVRKNIVRS